VESLSITHITSKIIGVGRIASYICTLCYRDLLRPKEVIALMLMSLLKSNAGLTKIKFY